MMTTLERRHSERARIPCNIPVELTDASHSSQFEADAVDLSVGGLSLRAARLPDLGSTLFCSFEAMPGGAQVLGRGEVVWRQASAEKEGGEFGLRFVEVDAKNQALIDEMVAERIARIDTAFTQPEPVIANLEIENVNAPVAARLVHNGENEALFEQALDLLALGKGVVAHAGVSLLRGNIASVGLRMDGQTPLLSIRLKLAREGGRFGEFEWGEPGSDTDPDVFGSSALHDDVDDDDDDDDESQPERRQAAAPSEPDDSSDEDEEDEDEDDDESEADDSVGTATLQGVGSPAPVPAPILARVDESAKQLPLQFRRESAHTEPELGALKLSIKERGDHEDVFADEDAAMRLLTEAAASSADWNQLPEAGDEEEHDDAEDTAVDDPANSVLVRVLRVFAAVQALLVRAREQLQAYWLKLRGRQVPRVAGASRGLFGGRTRKVIAASARTTLREPAAGKSQRLAALAIAVGGVTLVASVFMLMPSKKELPEEADSASRGADSGAQLVSANPAAAMGDNVGEGDAPNPVAAPGGSPYAVDVRAKNAPAKNAPAKPAAVSGNVFGAKSVPNGKRFVLRMRDPVKSLQGTAESDGFSVLVNGNKALDKAAGLKTQPSVGGAAIWNRKDTVELHVRFAPGKSPAYRVTANGPSLEVVIGP